MSCILNIIFPERCDFEPIEKFKMSSLVLIEMAITFEILKTYTGFGLILPIMNCSFRLNRLEVPACSLRQFLALVPWRFFRGQMCVFLASTVKRMVKSVLTMKTRKIYK